MWVNTSPCGGAIMDQSGPLAQSVVSMKLFPFLAFVLVALSARADPCPSWDHPSVVGTLNPKELPEASGLVVSRWFPNRLYHLNDGADNRIFVSDLRGGNLRFVTVGGVRLWDFEDMSLGPSPGGGSCLFLADIGDNPRRRDKLRVFLAEERDLEGPRVVPIITLYLSYPDGPHDAEGLAVHPNGDLYILTKEADWRSLWAQPAKLFRIKRDDWQQASGEVRRLSPLGEIDLPSLASSDADFLGRMVTALDISPDGRRFLVLTYQHAYEFQLDLSQILSLPRTLKGVSQVIQLKRLAQQEAVAYLPDGNGFIYTSELRRADHVPIVQVDCARDDR